MECYSATEKNEMMPFTAAWMQLEIISELETDRQISPSSLSLHASEGSQTISRYSMKYCRLKNGKRCGEKKAGREERECHTVKQSCLERPY